MDNHYTISECTEEFMIVKGINAKKYYVKWIIVAKNVWRELFMNTIYAVQSEWLPLQKGTPYNYIQVPTGVQRIFSVANTDACGEIKPLFYNNTLNVISKPTEKRCGCNQCDCGGLCDDVNNLTVIIKLLFTDHGVDYYEKTWLKLCANGDVIEYREVPAKKYNTFEGDTSPSDYTIVTEKFQNTICKLKVKECGCPEETPTNVDTLIEHCGCYLPVNCRCKRKRCDHFLGQINNNCLGEVKVSPCGTKIYFKPKGNSKVPDYLLLNYQLSGLNCTSAVIVPEYAIKTMWLGMEYLGNQFNNNFSHNDKKQMEYNYKAGQNDMILFLNPISLEELSQIQDAPIRF